MSPAYPYAPWKSLQELDLMFLTPYASAQPLEIFWKFRVRRSRSVFRRLKYSILFIYTDLVAPYGNIPSINEIENKQKEGVFQMLLSIKIPFS